jgi:hypothetical protein
MDKDAADILAALKAEANRVAYRKSLLLKVEALWAEDPQFRALIRGLVKTSSIKDKRGNKSSIDTKLAKSAIELGTSLGLTKNKILEILAESAEPKSIEKALLRDKKKRSQPT